MELTPVAVETILENCLLKLDEVENSTPVEVDGVVNRYVFHAGRLKDNKEQIVACLQELPDEFTQAGGGSFLNLCVDKHGNLWTGQHRLCEALLALGIAIGRARIPFPRKLWNICPGGVPYIVIEKEAEDGTAEQTKK